MNAKIEKLLDALSKGDVCVTFENQNRKRETIIASMKGRPFFQDSESEILKMQDIKTRQYVDVKSKSIVNWRTV